MKLHRLPEYILITTVLLAGMGLALYCGRAIGTGQTGTLVAIFAVAVAIFVLLLMRARVWMLIPITWGFAGQIYQLSLPFAVRDLAIVFVFTSFFALIALKVVRRKPVYEALDYLLFANILYVAIAFVRHPAGISVLGSNRVGGKPYFILFVACLAYWVLGRVLMSPKQALKLPFFMVAARSVEMVFNFVVFHFPSTAPVLSHLYSGVEVSAETPQGAKVIDVREGYLGAFAGPLLTGICSYFRPLTLFNPLYMGRFIGLLFGIYGLLQSGFRSMVMAFAFTFMAASYFHKGMIDLVKIVVFGMPIVIFLIASQGVLFEMPLPAQRALSFLPGNWNYIVVNDAKGSTEWRTQMWKIVLTTDKYIENKWLGDGFGFTMEQYKAMEQATAMRATEADIENQMIVGGVHSGPISAIRFVGVLGLVLYLILLVQMARYALRLIGRCRNTPFFVISLFIGIPAIFEPINYIFIFGGYEGSLPNSVFAVAMLRLISNSREAWQPAVEIAPAPEEKFVHVRSNLPSRLPVPA